MKKLSAVFIISFTLSPCASVVSKCFVSKELREPSNRSWIDKCAGKSWLLANHKAGIYPICIKKLILNQRYNCLPLLPNKTRTLPESCSVFVKTFFLSFFDDNQGTFILILMRCEYSLSINACYKGCNYSHVATWLSLSSRSYLLENWSLLSLESFKLHWSFMSLYHQELEDFKIVATATISMFLPLEYDKFFNGVSIKRNAERCIA